MPIFQHIVKSHSSNFIQKKYQTRLFIRWLIFNLLILHRKTIALLNWVGKEDYENYCKGWNTIFGQTLIILQASIKPSTTAAWKLTLTLRELKSIFVEIPHGILLAWVWISNMGLSLIFYTKVQCGLWPPRTRPFMLH